MKDWKQQLYFRAPGPLKELLVAAEARRRNRYRRFGDYQRVQREYSFGIYQSVPRDEIQRRQLMKLCNLFAHARTHSRFHRARLPEGISSLEDLHHVPIMEKRDLRTQANDILCDMYPKRKLWTGRTSGSTGSPTTYYISREGVRVRTAIASNYYAIYDCHYGERRVRIGGSRILPANTRKPPFWVFSRPDNQLNMSSYHLSPDTMAYYIEKLNDFRPAYITGYAFSLFVLGRYLADNGGLDFVPKCVFGDSEGITQEQQNIIEQGFGAKCYCDYGLTEAGIVAIQLPDYRYHVLELTALVEIVDDTGNPVPGGEVGRIIVTDLTQKHFPYIRYNTGDLGAFQEPDPGSHFNTLILSRIEGRSDDYIITPDGRQVGRLSYVTKPARGVLESQIVQLARDHVEIRVVPADDFVEDSMQEVLRVAKDIIGTDIQIDWKIVSHIPRTNRHKFRHVVRLFE